MTSGVRGTRQVFYFKCRTCKKPFSSTRPMRMFCSVKCRANHPTFKRFLKENLAIRNSRSGPHRKGKETPCPECAKPVYQRPGPRKQKFCGRVCYRAWYAKRFDRNIGAIDSVAQLSGYDEFLSGETLRCFQPGCSWEGHSLSHHMNYAHGIEAEALKEKAGFNKGTGVISATLARILEARATPGSHPPTDLAIASRAGASQDVRREAVEHLVKSALLRPRGGA